MQPQIIQLPEKKLVGIARTMSFLDYQVSELWQSFMPRRHEIQNVKSNQLFNIQVNPPGYSFDPETAFEKWAALEVDAYTTIPDGMQKLIIPAGRYAVFTYRGDGSNASDFFRSIFTQWLPEAQLQWENRPQFEVLSEKYQKNSPDSEELIFIPVL
ncbi:AraC family transcriptional regulator [Flavobacterium fontis]|uniref:AraC family transcriptional regulator n=1 Tax=Flavobacterium fontis TaxID=1124188 RepID=A0A1M5DRA7_9FLAO|nr:GyrI-like domain-containing protein [Flavobacterium fontis]SHF69548.1 AraC family transcriptional regulator [Flavobacterium fontis]